MAHNLSYRQMAHAHEKVEYLTEARRTYRNERPPFTQRGLTEPQSHITVRLLNGARETKTVGIRAYRTRKPRDTLYYATIRLHRHAYIIKPLPQDWDHGDSTESHSVDDFWLIWQGPEHHFLGPLFKGPVAQSVGHTDPGKTRAVASTPGRALSIPASNSSMTLPDRTMPGPSLMGAFQALRLSQSRSDSTSSLTAAAQEREDTATGAPTTADSVDFESGGASLALRPRISDANRTPTPIRDRMDEVTLGLAVGKSIDCGYIPMRLCEARPRDGGPLTMESLFEKITKVFTIKDKEFFMLRRAFVEGPVNSEPHQPNPEPTRQLWIGREAQQSWDDFLSNLRERIREHCVQGWHVRLHAYSA